MRGGFGRRGSHVTEFALVLPVVAILLGGTVEYCMYFKQRAETVSAVRQGARVGAMTDRQATPAPTTAAVTAANAAWTASGTNGTAPTFTAAETGTAPDVKIEVRGQLTYEPFMSVLDLVLPTGVDHTLKVRMHDQDP